MRAMVDTERTRTLIAFLRRDLFRKVMQKKLEGGVEHSVRELCAIAEELLAYYETEEPEKESEKHGRTDGTTARHPFVST